MMNIQTKPFVFICSRMEELSHSRRAVFEAVVDQGAVPVMYESAPLARHGGEQILAARKSVDELLAQSDFLVGIFYHTIGERLIEFAGLTAVQYELYRFLIEQRMLSGLIHRDPESLGKVRKDLDELFPCDRELEDNVPLQHEIRVIDNVLQTLALFAKVPSSSYRHRTHFAQILRDLSASSRVAGVQSGSKTINSYCHLFMKRVYLSRRALKYGGAVDSKLTEFLETKPYETYASQSSEQGDEGGRVFFPASDILHSNVTDWLNQRVHHGKRSSTVSEHLVRISSENVPGELSKVLDSFFHYRLNVIDVELGEDKSGRCIFVLAESSSSNLGRFRNADEQLEHLFSDLEQAGLPETSIRDNKGDFFVQHETEGHHHVGVRIANIPGMLFRVSALLLQFGVSIRCIKRDHGPARASNQLRTMRHFYIQCAEVNNESEEAVRRRLAHQLGSVVGVRNAAVIPPQKGITWARDFHEIPRLGECLAMLQHLDPSEIHVLLDYRLHGEAIGQAALRLDMITESQLTEGLHLQAKFQYGFG